MQSSHRIWSFVVLHLFSLHSNPKCCWVQYFTIKVHTMAWQILITCWSIMANVPNPKWVIRAAQNVKIQWKEPSGPFSHVFLHHRNTWFFGNIWRTMQSSEVSGWRHVILEVVDKFAQSLCGLRLSFSYFLWVLLSMISWHFSTEIKEQLLNKD